MYKFQDTVKIRLTVTEVNLQISKVNWKKKECYYMTVVASQYDILRSDWLHEGGGQT